MGQADHGLEDVLFVSSLSHSCADAAFRLIDRIFLARRFCNPWPGVQQTHVQKFHGLVVMVAWQSRMGSLAQILYISRRLASGGFSYCNGL